MFGLAIILIAALMLIFKTKYYVYSLMLNTVGTIWFSSVSDKIPGIKMMGFGLNPFLVKAFGHGLQV